MQPPFHQTIDQWFLFRARTFELRCRLLFSNLHYGQQHMLDDPRHAGFSRNIADRDKDTMVEQLTAQICVHARLSSPESKQADTTVPSLRFVPLVRSGAHRAVRQARAPRSGVVTLPRLTRWSNWHTATVPAVKSSSEPWDQSVVDDVVSGYADFTGTHTTSGIRM